MLTRNTTKRAAADPRLKPLGHWDRNNYVHYVTVWGNHSAPRLGDVLTHSESVSDSREGQSVRLSVASTPALHPSTSKLLETGGSGTISVPLHIHVVILSTTTILRL